MLASCFTVLAGFSAVICCVGIRLLGVHRLSLVEPLQSPPPLFFFYSSHHRETICRYLQISHHWLYFVVGEQLRSRFRLADSCFFRFHAQLLRSHLSDRLQFGLALCLVCACVCVQIKDLQFLHIHIFLPAVVLQDTSCFDEWEDFLDINGEKK